MRSTNLQKLLQKDAANTTAKEKTSSPNNTTAAAKGNVSEMLKDKQSRSSNENKLTTDKNEVVLRQQKSEPQERFSFSLIEKTHPSATGKENPSKDVKASPSPKTPDSTKSGVENKKSEEKYKVKKSLSPSLTALIEKDAKNCQKEDKTNENKSVEVNGTSPSKTNENSTSKSVEPLDSWGAFELKLQNKVKQSAEKLKRGTPDTRGSFNTRGSHDKRGSESENLTILIEDTTNAGKEVKKIGRTVSKESRDSIDGKPLSPENIKQEMTHTAGSRNFSPGDDAAKTASEDQVKLSVNGDQITIPSVRARKNSFLTSEESSDSDGGKNTNQRKRVSSFSLNDDSKTVVIEGDTPKHSNGVKSSNETSGHRKRVGSFHLNDEQNTVIIENNVLPHSLTTKETSVSRTVSQSSTNSRGSISSEGKNNRVLNLSREASLDNTEPKLRSSSFGRSETEHSLTGSKNEAGGENGLTSTITESEKQKDTGISESVKTSKSKDENVVKTSGRAMPKILLADLLAKDDTLSQDAPGRAADTEQNPADSTNLYKDKLKGLKKTTTYYASEPITLGDRGNSSGKQGKADAKSCSLQNGLDTSLDKTSDAKSTDVNNISENKDISHTSKTEVLKSNSTESNSSQKSKLSEAESKRESLEKIMHIPSAAGMIV